MKHIASLSFLIFMSCQSPPISIHQTQSLMYQNRETPPNEIQSVQTGLDVLLDSLSEELKGKSIALVTNHTGI
ncbi:MAG: hypothetical protein HOC46_03940, partial [Candidatus Marinimicrobia bacterium]|nr:hypothetical protein [Candidatus Neomarinimicrobiota bacterium]MBT6159658.1 hypothetical protein [Candidatus Neomarinimicrobiota bacterium]MBT6914853.1 hypothetical protein [Candidatus Neomarinimicrobiota bacterium]